MLDDFPNNDDLTIKHDPSTNGTNANGQSNAPTWTSQPPIRPPVPTVVNYYKDTTFPPPPPPLSRESAARERMRRRRIRGRQRGGEWAWVIIAGAMLGVVVIISMSFFLLLRASSEKQEVMPTALAALPTPVDARTDFSAGGTLATGQQVTLDDGHTIVIEPWDGKSRFTVLLVGLDRRPGETGLAYRTDTMLLVSVDPNAHTLGMLSIPRDLYVVVPGYSQRQRVNTPMVLGEIVRPGNGPTLMMQTVQYNFGIHVHDYMVVDFNAFITVVDAIGGVDIDVPYNIADPQYPDMYYGYDPFYLRAGPQHLNGATALKYARTRHGDSDFQRAERQQQVISAIRDKVLSLNMLPQLIIQAPSMFGNLKDDVYTGLTLDQLIQLAWYMKDIPADNIHKGVVDEHYSVPWTTPDGAQVLVPDSARLGPLMVNVFGADYSG